MHKREKTISIITVVCNNKKSIEDCIKSVLSQSYRPIEYIVIDGASDDGTMDIVNKYKDRINIIVSEKDHGIYDAMNKGIGLASGDYIAFLNSDDFYIAKDVIEKIMNMFEEKSTDSLYSDLYYVDTENTDKIIRHWVSGNYEPGMFGKGWHPPHPTFIVKRQIFQKYGNFDLSLKIASDYELMLRFLEKHRISVCYLREAIVKMRIKGESNKNIFNIIYANWECYKAWRMNNLKTNPLIMILKPMSKIKQLISFFTGK
jgi:glycosyltransferase involved in cell wall biosynthesis